MVQVVVAAHRGQVVYQLPGRVVTTVPMVVAEALVHLVHRGVAVLMALTGLLMAPPEVQVVVVQVVRQAL